MPVCAFCGTPVPPPFRVPPPEGSPDLDGRPGEPARSTMRRWVQVCPGCGACAPDLARLPRGVQDRPPDAPLGEAASPFERWAVLVQGLPEEAEAWLQAAWLAEDEGLDGAALRRRALAVWPAPDSPEGLVRLADIQRRTGLLSDAAATLDRLDPHLTGSLAQIAAFERARIAAEDTGRHLLSSALRPPARSPHVSHGQHPTAGFWARMLKGFGR